MRKTIFSVLCCAVVLLTAGLSVNAYEVVMKNGKTVKGDLVSQNDTMIVLKDASGIQIQLKKSMVDLPATEAANPAAAPAPATAPAPAAAPAPAPEKKKTTARASEKAKEQHKKPVRVYTQKDLDRMREKHDLGEGTFAEGVTETEPSTTQAADKDAKNAEAREKKIADLQKQIEQTQSAYDSLSKQCDYLKTTNFQTTRLTDAKGNPLPYYDTIKSTCENADKAKANLDQLNQQLSTLQQQ